MVIKSRWTCEIPEQSLPSWVFGSPTAPLVDMKQFIDPERPETHFLTLAQYRLWSQRIALGLKAAGLQEGDRVLMFSGNNIFFPCVFMGTIMAGGVFTGANPSFVTRELAYQLKDSGAAFLITANASLEVALEAAKETGLDKSRIFVFDDTALDKTIGKGRLGVKHWTSLMDASSRAKDFVWFEPRDPRDTVCCLNYRYEVLRTSYESRLTLTLRCAVLERRVTPKVWPSRISIT
jgi:4-coumarate--CoA ligase